MSRRIAALVVLVVSSSLSAGTIEYIFRGIANGFNEIGPIVDRNGGVVVRVDPFMAPTIVGNTATYAVDSIINAEASTSSLSGQSDLWGFPVPSYPFPPPLLTNTYNIGGGSITVTDDENGEDRFQIIVEGISNGDAVNPFEPVGAYTSTLTIDLFASVNDGSAGPTTSLTGIGLPTETTGLDPASFDSATARLVLTETASNTVVMDYTIDLMTITVTGVPEPASMALLGIGAVLLQTRRRRQGC